MTVKPNPPPSQTFNDVLAKMMQAQASTNPPPAATPCEATAEERRPPRVTRPSAPDRRHAGEPGKGAGEGAL